MDEIRLSNINDAWCSSVVKADGQCFPDRYEVISSHMTKQLDGIFIAAGDFNQTDLRSVLPK